MTVLNGPKNSGSRTPECRQGSQENAEAKKEETMSMCSDLDPNEMNICGKTNQGKLFKTFDQFIGVFGDDAKNPKAADPRTLQI